MPFTTVCLSTPPIFKRLDVKHKQLELKGRAKITKIFRSFQQVANDDLKELKDFLNSELIDSQSISSTDTPDVGGSSEGSSVFTPEVDP